MKTYFGSFYLPGYTTSTESTVLVYDKVISMGYRRSDGSNETMDWSMKDVEVVLENHQTKIRNPKFPRYELFIEGNDADNYIKEIREEQQKAWYKKSSGKEWMRNTFLLLVIAGSLFLLYLLIVPWLSSKLASKVSIKREAQIGDAVYDAMDLAGREDTAASYILNEFFAAMDIPTAYRIKITVVNDHTVNAFALPGGRIVVFSALLKEVDTYPELAALLSHEFTHINNKHTTRSRFLPGSWN